MRKMFGAVDEGVWCVAPPSCISRARRGILSPGRDYVPKLPHHFCPDNDHFDLSASQSFSSYAYSVMHPGSQQLVARVREPAFQL